ncbi:MAG: poly-gamma-glutamate synthase PgsB [Candidatus Eisenbacteria bacterium]|nr:poly-gamma-glutamate synthase PgsB [Candidatus Eisenbacteria bacterium]
MSVSICMHGRTLRQGPRRLSIEVRFFTLGKANRYNDTWLLPRRVEGAGGRHWRTSGLSDQSGWPWAPGCGERPNEGPGTPPGRPWRTVCDGRSSSGGALKILFLALAIALGLWVAEAWRHWRALRSVPIRIHVNGSRGKSSVTRLLAAALREAGVRTFAKTTGSRAHMILPDGSEEPIIRVSTPNICEQIRILDRARREKAEAIVMECMAVRPDLQRVSELHIMRSTIGVITNVRADHLDVMGPTLEDVALSLAGTLPRKGKVVLGENRFQDLLGPAAKSRGSSLLAADPGSVPLEAMQRFGYVEHRENVATVLAITRELEIEDEVALRGMYKATPDVGACTRWRLQRNGAQIEFLNAFAANDLESTIALWDRLGLGSEQADPTFVLLNLRGDRLDRSLQFAEVLDNKIRADYYFLVGDLSNIVLRRFERSVPRERLMAMGRAEPGEIFDAIAKLSPEKSRVGGIGNIGGLGHEILAYVAGSGGSAC